MAIETGESVTWDFDGSTVVHNVKGESGPAEDPDWAGYRSQFLSSGEVSRTFTQPGTYTFVCEAHPQTMTGSVTVTGAAVTPTPTPTPTATPTATATATAFPQPTASPTPAPDHGTPAPSGSARLDTVAPAISRLRVRALRRGARVAFKLSEPALVTLRVKRGKATVRTVRLAARAGTRTVRLSRLARGRYTVEIEARDARGNHAAAQRKAVRVTR